MKLFLKILGGILYGFLLILVWSLYLGILIAGILGIIWAWTKSEHDTETKVYVTGLCVMGIFFALGLIYMILEDHVNGTSRYYSITPPKPISPTGTRKSKKPEPILGHNKPNRTMTASESEPD